MTSTCFQRESRRRMLARLLAIGCTLGLVHGLAADATNIQWDWETRTASCPPKVAQSTRVTLTVTGINDVLIDFQTGDRAEYQFRAKGSPVSVVPENLFAGLGGQSAALVVCDVRAHFDALVNAVISARNRNLTPPSPGGPSIPLADSIDAARSIREVGIAEADMADVNCVRALSDNASHPAFRWLKRLAGSHSATFNINLEPNMNYEFFLQEYWKGKPTSGSMHIACGETEILTLSLGPLVTTLPYRTYDHQKAPIPPGGSTTQDILTVGGNSNVSLLGAALLNFHLPPVKGLPQWTGLTLSAGPVYKLGTAPGVSSLGIFAGGSIHLYRSVFLTPGVHIGEFADFPAGFYPGAKIPDQFGDLKPIKRTTAHFAIGITFKTTTFKKSSQDGGAAKNTGGMPADTPAPNTQPVTGNKGNPPK